MARTGLFQLGAEAKIGTKTGCVAPGEPATPVNLLKTKEGGLAERVGFEPTCRLPDKTLSRRPRYDHFGTSPLRKTRVKRDPQL